MISTKVFVSLSLNWFDLAEPAQLHKGVAFQVFKPNINLTIMENQDLSPLLKASYGLYVLSTKKDEKDNACIVNTFLQVTDSSPVICLVSVNKKCLTTDMISETGKLNLSVLTIDTPMELIKRFGYQSGRDIDKFKEFTDFDRSENELTYCTKYANAFYSLQVLESYDCDTHIVFKAILTESAILNNKESMTYDYYQQHVKSIPKVEKQVGYQCTVCGTYHGKEAPREDEYCYVCHHDASHFEKIGDENATP